MNSAGVEPSASRSDACLPDKLAEATSDRAESSTACAESDTCSVQPASDLSDLADVQMLPSESESFPLDCRKRKRSVESIANSSDPSIKSRLHDACAAILNRRLRPGDIVYELPEADVGGSSSSKAFVMRLRLPSLPGSLGARAWMGGPCAGRGEARLKAAAAALETLEMEQAVPQDDAIGSVGPKQAAGIEESGSLDTKSKLSIFLQWKCGRTLEKGDVTYSTSRQGGMYRTTLKLHCLDGLEFEGDPAVDAKAAQDAAALNVLNDFPSDIERMTKIMQSKKIFLPAKRRKLPVRDDALPNVDSKAQSKLHDVLSTMLRRDLAPGDMVYDVIAEAGSYVGHLRVPCVAAVDGASDLAQRVWSSPKRSSKRDARASVAGLALADLLQRFPAQGASS
eukprot:TRINITY_DN26262_c0_g1_i2.p1 TRINITY_DN26262_c0_g1~~TRINITY_DN26262_c0_g1_i2.p1  ORF type:complete len:396 (-),score=69.71 TRINITY_DN26262_c0_g1_i2:75-1262(-)